MDVSLVQASNALSPIEVTERGIVTEVRRKHRRKALCRIEVTHPGIVMEVNALHSLNALSVIEVIEPERMRENLQP